MLFAKVTSCDLEMPPLLEDLGDEERVEPPGKEEEKDGGASTSTGQRRATPLKAKTSQT